MARREPLCVGCRQHPVDPAWRPFCSERCKLVDLDRWLSGDYRVPEDPHPPAAAPGEDDDGENP